MAATTALETAPQGLTDEDLTDEQIDQLLARATARLRSKSSAKVTAKKNEPQKYTIPKLNAGDLEKPYVSTKGDVATVDAARFANTKQTQKKANGMRIVQAPAAVKKMAEEQKKATAGKDWYNLPRTNLTPNLKRDLQLLKMRTVLDPHRHYKKDGGGKMKAPEYSQVGTIVEGPTEFFSGRIDNKKRKRTFVEEVLAGEQETGRFKRKYGELQGRKTSGKKAYYKGVMAKRRGGVKKGG